jgi:methionyl aminopeptidase
VVRDLAGHGIGRTILEAPSIPSYDDPRMTTRLTGGLVITIEPIVAQRSAAWWKTPTAGRSAPPTAA